jgi:hypothetical protein
MTYFPHSPRATAAIRRIAVRIYRQVENYENGDFRDHVQRASWFNYQIWHDGQKFVFDDGDVYLATLRYARGEL